MKDSHQFKDRMLTNGREREFLNDILRLKNDSHNWNGKHMIDYTFNGGDNGNGWFLNMSKELSFIGSGDKWTYQYQRRLKSRILCKSDRILADTDLDQKCQLLPISLGMPLPKYTIKHHKTLGLRPHIESYKTPTSKYLELGGNGHKGHIPCQSTPQTATKVS